MRRRPFAARIPPAGEFWSHRSPTWPRVSAAERTQAWGQRAVLPLLTLLLTLTTAIALLVTALTLAPFPAPAAIPARAATAASVPSPAAARAVAPPSIRRVVLARSEPVALPSTPLALVFARLTYRPGISGGRQAVPGPLLVVVDHGALTARLDARGWLQRAAAGAAAAGDDCRGACRLAVGDSLLLPSMTAAAFQSLGATPAVVLAAAVVPAAAAITAFGREPAALARADPPRWDATWSPGAEATSLVGGWVVDLDAPTATLTLARLSVDPGAQGTLPAIGTQAVVVETGAVTLTTEHGLSWRQRREDGDQWLGSGTPTTLLGGEAALLQAGASAGLRNDGGGPLQLVALTVAAA